MRRPKTKFVVVMLIGLFLFIGPIVQTKFLQPTPVQAPPNASPASRGFIEGSQEGSKVGSELSMVLGLFMAAGGLAATIGSVFTKPKDENATA